ncbi:formate dehydrogenase [Raoultibacter timonensis]|uniref:Formate dehydrogenase n=2 Tax=Raoultibacter timonensis TaxID=1907662 RepID=A0ABM7WEX1_9ACTN|nr:formate dehydrogenase [Raoultibacter timonensis]BDF49323.1 formate dehydrogenase [Raoultibacter timonensis]
MLSIAGASTIAASTGALSLPSLAFGAEEGSEEFRYSHCVMCNHGPHCGVKALVKDNKILRLEKRDGYNNNLLCAKGLSSTQDLYDPARVLYPLRRVNAKGSPGEWERITWDEALAEIAEKFNGIKEKHGAEKVLFMTGDPKEPRSALQRLAFTFGSPNMGTESSTCFKATELAVKLIVGPEWHTATSLATGAGPTPGKTKVCIIWGNNPGWSAPFSYNGLKTGQESGQVKYIVVDPRITPTAQNFADVHLQIRPGTDGALALCFANYLIEHDAYDKDFIENWAHGFEEYREYCTEFTLEKTAEICDIPVETLQKACDILVTEGSPIVCKSAAAFPHHTNGINNYRAIMLLIPLTGSLDVPGGLSIENEPINFDEWWGTFEFARSKELLPELDHLRVDRQYFPVWADTDQQGSLQLNKIPEYVENGDIRACLMLGGNAMMWPQSHEYQEAFKNMEFVVAGDFYNNAWTHDYVDMLLPVAMSFERAAPLTIFGRKVFLREPIVEPAGEARSDYRICCDIGTALGFGDVFWNGGPESDENCLREILRTIDVENPPTLEDLRAAHPDPIEIPLKGEAQSKKYELGLLRDDGQPGFSSPSGKVEFASEILREHGFDPLPVFNEPVYSPVSTPDVAKDYPLVMNSGSRVPYYTHSKERHLPWLNQFMPEPVVRLSKADAEERGLADGDMVRITSPVNDEGIVAKLEITNIVRPKTIDMFHGWHQANVNEIISRDFDPISGFPPFKEGLCQVAKA